MAAIIRCPYNIMFDVNGAKRIHMRRRTIPTDMSAMMIFLRDPNLYVRIDVPYVYYFMGLYLRLRSVL